MVSAQVSTTQKLIEQLERAAERSGASSLPADCAIHLDRFNTRAINALMLLMILRKKIDDEESLIGQKAILDAVQDLVMTAWAGIDALDDDTHEILTSAMAAGAIARAASVGAMSVSDMAKFMPGKST